MSILTRWNCTRGSSVKECRPALVWRANFIFTKLPSLFHSNLLKHVIVVDRVYHANKTKKSYESKGHGDQINTSKSITNRLSFLFCFCFVFRFLLLFPFLYHFSFSSLTLSFYLLSVNVFLSSIDLRNTWQVGNGLWQPFLHISSYPSIKHSLFSPSSLSFLFVY